MTDLENALRAVGFATAALGTCAAVAPATWRLIEALRVLIERLLKGKPPATAPSQGRVKSLSVHVSGAVRPSYVTGGTIEERLKRIEQRLDGIDKQSLELAGKLDTEVIDRRTGDNALHKRVDTEIGQVHQALTHQQDTDERINANALPAVLVGAFLSSFPDVLAMSTLVGTLALCVGLGFFFHAWSQVDAARPKRHPSD